MEYRIADNGDCVLISSLAYRIWGPTYSHLMEPAQLEYMFDMMYSPSNLHNAMTEGQTFLIFSDGGDDIGYISYDTLENSNYYLQKIYLLPEKQGSGNGRSMLEMFLAYLRTKDPSARRIKLNVNRENRKAIDFYHRNGFEIVGRRDHPIGNGYFMNDYILEREI